MADEWQLKAVHEQFKILENRKELTESSLNCSKVRLNKFVVFALIDHLKAASSTLATLSLEKIISRISEAKLSITDGYSKKFTLSFIVIVTNEEISDGLCKIPVFFLEAGNKCVYIDISCSLYNSWDAFLQNNDLPSCQFCYPVDGKYLNSGKLKINYARSPVSKYLHSGGNLSLRTSRCKVVSADLIAGSFFFKLGKCATFCVGQLIPLAKKLIPVLARCAKATIIISDNLDKFKRGKTDVFSLIELVFSQLSEHYESISQEAITLWKEIKLRFGNICSFICKEFGFDELPGSEPSYVTEDVLAKTYKLDSELKEIKNNADTLVQASAILSETFSVSSSVIIQDNDITPTSHIMSQNQLVQNILTKSKECYEKSGKGAKEIVQETRDTVAIAANIVKHIQGSGPQNIYADTFETLAETFKKSYKESIDDYVRLVKAAEKGAGHKIDLAAFNHALGIYGDFKVHFWNKCLLKHWPKLGEEIKMKLKQLDSNSRIMMHAITPENSLAEGKLFLWKSNKNICEKDILCALKENVGLQIKEEHLVTNSYSFNIFIQNEDYIILVYQKDPSSNEGLIFIHKS